MRVLLKVALSCLALVTLFFGSAFCWFRFYTRDLPDTKKLAQFIPAAPTPAFDTCRKTSSPAIPYEMIGENLRAALNAVGVTETGPGVLSVIYHSLAEDSNRNTATLSFQISRTMFCSPAKPLRRQLDELRFAEQLEQHFSPRELFTIYANRAYFGDDVIGVQSAALHFFGRIADELTVAEAALLAGIVQSPSRYSPAKHSDRALQRRNEVLDAMVANGTITASTATAAKSTNLGIITKSSSTQ